MFAIRIDRAIAARAFATLILITLPTEAVLAQPDGGTARGEPWWTQQKIRYFWGQWTRHRGEIRPDLAWHRRDTRGVRADYWSRSVGQYLAHNEVVIKKLSQVGATVFVRYRPGFPSVHDEMQARLARKHGLRYFGIIYLYTFAAHAHGPPRPKPGR